MLYISYVIRIPAGKEHRVSTEILKHLVEIYEPIKLTCGVHKNTTTPHYHIHLLSDADPGDPKFGKNRSRLVRQFDESITSRIISKTNMIDDKSFFSYPLKEYDQPNYRLRHSMPVEEHPPDSNPLPDDILNHCTKIGKLKYSQVMIESMRSNANFAYKIAHRMSVEKQERIKKYSAATADLYEHLDVSCNIQTKPPKVEDFKSETAFIAAVAQWNSSPNYKKLYHTIGTQVCQYYLNKEEVPPDKTADQVLHYMIIKKLLKADQLWQIKNKYKVNI